MASTYVQLTREEFETWLDTLGQRWALKPGRVGIYVVSLSPRVAIEVSSSMTGRDDVVTRAQASMGVKLVSLVTGHTLNKKAQEQSHVKRTTNWRDNLRRVYDRMLDAYRRSESFYEAIAEIEDRDKYKIDTLAKIESISGWGDNNFLSDLHKRVTGNGVLTHKQMAAVDRAAQPRPQRTPEDQLPRLRGLWAVARQKGDRAAMQAAEQAAAQVKGGHPLPDAMNRNIRQLLAQYRSEIEAWLASNQERANRVAARWMDE